MHVTPTDATSKNDFLICKLHPSKLNLLMPPLSWHHLHKHYLWSIRLHHPKRWKSHVWLLKGRDLLNHWCGGVKTLKEAQVPKWMKQATHWAVHAFDEWVTSKNTVACNMFSCPDLLKPYPPAVLDQWLAAFFMEVRKGDGTHYSPDSLCSV